MLDGITTAICRPPRAQYSSADLGPPRVRYRGVEYKRKDFSVRNSRQLAVRGSVWELINPRQGDSESCILYLHPNSGSRVDVVKTRIMSVAATAKCTVCGFDFAGCGSSDGESVSLGVREKEDICAVMSFLLSRGCKRFVLWGRSMGAASAAMFFGAYKEVLRGAVAALVLDSPFTSMQGLAAEYTSSTKIPVPNLLLAPALHLLRQNILSKHGFDIMHISPLAAAARVTVPTVVLSGSDDKIVPPSLSHSIYEALNGPKLRIFFQGGHNTHRPTVIFDAIRVVLTGALRGLQAEEFLRLAEEVVTNPSPAPRPSSSEPSVSSTSKGHEGAPPSSAASSSRGERGRACQEGAKKSEQSIAAKLTAVQQEQLASSLLQGKAVHSLTEQDIEQAIGTGDRKKPTSLSTESHGASSRRSEGGVLNKATVKDSPPPTSSSAFPCVVQLDAGGRFSQRGGAEQVSVEARSSWSESIGHFFWGRAEHQGSPPPPGSLGFLQCHLADDVCPPDPAAWEQLLQAQAVAVAFDAALDEIVSIAAGLETARLECRDQHSDMDEKDEALMMSMVVAQVTAEMGLVSVRGRETSSWGRLLPLSLVELQRVARALDQQDQERRQDDLGCPPGSGSGGTTAVSCWSESDTGGSSKPTN